MKLEYDYHDFNEYYERRTSILQLQDGKNHVKYRLIKKQLKKNDKILDVGCGRGLLVNPLTKAGYDIRGVDISRNNVKICKEHDLEVSYADAVKKLPFPPNTFDVIFCTEVLEHLQKGNRKKILENIKRVLKKGGKLITTVPLNERFERNIATCPHCKSTFHWHGHTISFTPDTMKKMMRKAGFSFVKQNFVYGVIYRKVWWVPLMLYRFITKLRLSFQGDLLIVWKKK